jgi:hypothetical protein
VRGWRWKESSAFESRDRRGFEGQFARILTPAKSSYGKFCDHSSLQTTIKSYLKADRSELVRGLKLLEAATAKRQ